MKGNDQKDPLNPTNISNIILPGTVAAHQQASPGQTIIVAAGTEPPARTRHVLPALSHQQVVARFLAKRMKILVFLADGEVFTIMLLLTHLLRLSVREVQSVLAKMVRDKLLIMDKLSSSMRLYGISDTGAALVQGGAYRIFSRGKTKPQNVEHPITEQMLRIEFERLYGIGFDSFVPGRRLYRNPDFKKVPDFLLQMGFRNIAGEIELYVKAWKVMKAIIQTYCDALGEMDDKSALLHGVLYCTPHYQAVLDRINKLVPDELRSRFHVHRINPVIRPYKKEGKFVDDDLDRFLNSFR